MDFLTLLIVYCLIFVVGSLCILYRDAKVLNTGPVGALRNLLIESLTNLIPRPILQGLSAAGHYLLFQRNFVFQLIFLILVILGHTVFLVDMLPILHQHHPNQNHTFWPFVALFLNYYCFHKAWIGDPGEITAKTLEKYKDIYTYDGVLYQETKCRTCSFIKPARSKHCSTCNRCVHRFDHHCIWTNNCVGGLNHRYFILFMVTLIIIFLQGISVGTHCLLMYAQGIRLWEASYEDKSGQIQPMNISVAFQHMFLTLPRLMFLVVALVVLTILVAVFLGQHIYYVFLNQTTNERHKTEIAVNQSICQPHCENRQAHDFVDNFKEKNLKKNGTNKFKRTLITKKYRPYDKGLINNFLEVFLPFQFLSKAKLKVN